MLLNYKNFSKNNVSEGKVIEEIGEKTIDTMIDDAYKHFKEIKKPINTLGIIEHVEEVIGKELDDDDYEVLYYKITGESLDGDEIFDLDEEEKFIVR